MSSPLRDGDPDSDEDSRPLFSAFALSQTPDLPSVFKPRRERTALSADELAFHRDRHASSRRLLSTWEAVARKYKDVTLEEDDEIDLWTGKIVQDRGRLRAMERARDFGAPDDDDDVPSSEITEDEESYGSGEEEEEEEERADGDEPADEDDDEDDDLGGWDESQFESPSRLISPAIAIAGTPTGGLRIHFPPPRAALSHARDELDDEDLREFLAEEERARAGRRVESNVDEEEEQQSSEIDELDALSSQSEDGQGEEMIDDKEETPEEQGVYEEMLEEEEESDEPSDEESGEEDVFGPRHIDLSLLDRSRSGSPQRVASDSETSDDMNILSSEDESTASEDEDPDRTPRKMAGLAVTRSSCPTATNSPPSPPPSVSPPPPFQQRVPVHLAVRTKPRPPSPPRISPLKQRVLSGANQLQHVRTVPSPLRHVSYPSLPVVPAPTRAHTSALPTPPLSNASTASICSIASDRSSTPKASNQASSLCSRLPPPRLRVRFVSPSQESDDGDDDLAPLRSEHTASTPTHRTRSRLALRPLISRAFVDERKGIILLPPLPTGSSDDEEAVRTKKKAKKAATARRKDPDLFFPVRQAVVPPSLKRQDLPNGRSAEDGLPHDPSTSIVGKDDVSSGDDNMQRGHSRKRRRTSTSDTPSVTILPRDILVPSPTESDRKFLGRLHPPTIFPAHAVLPVKKEIPLHVPLTDPTEAPPLHKLIRDTWPSVARTEPESYWREEGAIVTLDSPNLLPSVKSMAARLKLRSSVRDYHQWWEAAGGPAGAIERSRQRVEEEKRAMSPETQASSSSTSLNQASSLQISLTSLQVPTEPLVLPACNNCFLRKRGSAQETVCLGRLLGWRACSFLDATAPRPWDEGLQSTMTPQTVSQVGSWTLKGFIDSLPTAGSETPPPSIPSVVDTTLRQGPPATAIEQPRAVKPIPKPRLSRPMQRTIPTSLSRPVSPNAPVASASPSSRPAHSSPPAAPSAARVPSALDFMVSGWRGATSTSDPSTAAARPASGSSTAPIRGP